MAFGRWSINTRLLVLQLLIGFTVVYLRVVLYDLRHNQTLPVPTDSAAAVVKVQQSETKTDSKEVENRPTPPKKPVEEDEVKVQADPAAANEPNNQHSKLFRCPSLRRPKKYEITPSESLTPSSSETWTVLKGDAGSAAVYVYSTHYDNRRRRLSDGSPLEHLRTNGDGASGYDWLRILVTASGLIVEGADNDAHKTDVFCHIWYNGTVFPVVVEARVSLLKTDDVIDSSDFRSYVVACPLSSEINPLSQMVPRYVSLSIGSECGGGGTETEGGSPDAVLFPVNSLAPAVAPQEELPALPDAKKVERVMVCVAPVDKKMLDEWSAMYDDQQQIRAPWLVEWMELLRLFGVAQVTMYTSFDNIDNALPAVRQLIDFYTTRLPSKQRLVVRPLPDPVPNNGGERIKERLAAIAYNDCLWRYGARFRFVMSLSDADELIIPRQKLGNYSAVFQQLELVKRNPFLATALSVRGATFYTDAKTAVLRDSFLTTVRHRMRSKIHPLTGNHVIDPLRCAELSSSGACISELTFAPAGSSQPKVVEVPMGVGVLYRYRACAPAAEDDNKNSCAVDKDNALMRFQQQLKLNIVQTLKDSGLVTGQEQLLQVAIRL